GAPDNGGGKFQKNRAAILRQRATRQNYPIFREAALLHRPREPRPMCWARRLWDDKIEGVADGLRRLEPKEGLGPMVPHANHPSTIRKEDGVRRGCNQHGFQESRLQARAPFSGGGRSWSKDVGFFPRRSPCMPDATQSQPPKHLDDDRTSPR